MTDVVRRHGNKRVTVIRADWQFATSIITESPINSTAGRTVDVRAIFAANQRANRRDPTAANHCLRSGSTRALIDGKS